MRTLSEYPSPARYPMIAAKHRQQMRRNGAYFPCERDLSTGKTLLADRQKAQSIGLPVGNCVINLIQQCQND